MPERFQRTRMLLGDAALERLAASRVAVFGVGGVGGYVVEALARSGVGALELVDGDTVALSNVNRQIIATESSVGRAKVDVAAERVRDINPACRVTARRLFFLPENADEFDFSAYDFVVDAVDTVTAKLAVVERCAAAKTPVISAMGAGNKLDPSAFEVADISKTTVDPLARVMRRELRKRGINHLKVVYSREQPLSPEAPSDEAGESGADEGSKRRSTPGSVAFVPSVAGLIIAGEVVRDLCGISRGK